MNVNIGSFLTRRADISPDREAYVDAASGTRLTFSELNVRSNRLSHQLLHRVGEEELPGDIGRRVTRCGAGVVHVDSDDEAGLLGREPPGEPSVLAHPLLEQPKRSVW